MDSFTNWPGGPTNYWVTLEKSKNKFCIPLDSDLDLIPNYLDEDDDNDGYSDYLEIGEGTSILDKDDFPSLLIKG